MGTEGEQRASLAQARRLKVQCRGVVTRIRQRQGRPSGEVRMEELLLTRKAIQYARSLEPPITNYFEALYSLTDDDIEWRSSSPSLRLLVTDTSSVVWLGMEAHRVGPLGLMVTSFTASIFRGERILTEILPVDLNRVDSALAAKLDPSHHKLRKYVGAIGPVFVAKKLVGFSQARTR